MFFRTNPNPTPPPPTPSGPAQRTGRSFGPRGSAAQTDRPRPLEGEGFRAAAMKLCGFDIGLDQPIFMIAGPCVIESMQLQLDVAGQLKETTSGPGINFRPEERRVGKECGRPWRSRWSPSL